MWQPTHIKPISKAVLSLAHVQSFLARQGRTDLIDHLNVLRSLPHFEATVLTDCPPPVKARKSRLPQRIFDECEQAGILKRITRPTVGMSVPLKSVPDRKNDQLGRIILPVCPLNAISRRPPPTPLPDMHDFVTSLLRRRWILTADARSWFFSFPVAEEVAAKYFVTRGPTGQFYAHVRGVMGWCWMPYLAGSVAQELASFVADECNGVGFAWIDDFTLGFDTKVDAEAAADQLRLLAHNLGFELHDVCIAERTVAVGVQLDSRLRAWRLAPGWALKAHDAWLTIRTRRHVNLGDLCSVTGMAAWATYVRGIPLFLLADAARFVSRLLQASSNPMMNGATLPRRIRDDLDVIYKEIRMNRWIRTRPICTSTVVVSDACVEGNRGGRAFMATVEGRVVQISEGVSDPAHINLEELVALAKGVKCSDAADECVAITDSRVVFHWLQKFNSGGNEEARIVLADLHAFLKRNRCRLRPLWMSTENMSTFGVDEASRWMVDHCEPCDPSRTVASKVAAEQDTAAFWSLGSLVLEALGPKDGA